MERKNINRGFKKLRVWQVEDPVVSGDAISLYILACKIFANFPFELKKVAANSIDAAHSISRNIPALLNGLCLEVVDFTCTQDKT